MKITIVRVDGAGAPLHRKGRVCMVASTATNHLELTADGGDHFDLAKLIAGFQELQRRSEPVITNDRPGGDR